MSAEIVMQVDENGNETGKARLVLAKEGGWHGLGEVLEHPTLEDVHRILGTDHPVTVEKIYYRNADDTLGMEIPDARAFSWMNGAQRVHLGIVGDQTAPLQNKDFINSLKPWLDQGLGEIESAGLLKGGRVIFAQIRVTDLKPATIRTLKDGQPDEILPFIGLTNGHGGMGMSGGRTDIRRVCWNTVLASLSQMSENGSLMKKTHRARAIKDGKQAEAEASLKAKMDEIHAFLIAQQKDFEREVEALRFLASKPVKPLTGATSIDKTLWQYAERVDKNNKKFDDVLAADFKPGKFELELATKFVNGIGCEGQSWFDAHAAVTEILTYGKANEMKGDRPGDAEARRMYDLWFGSRNSKLDAALQIALEMAQKQA